MMLSLSLRVRSAIGTYGGQFKNVSGVPLGVPVMAEAIKRAQIDPAVIDDVGWGCCYQRARNEVNIARVTAVKAGVPVEGSGLHRNACLYVIHVGHRGGIHGDSSGV